MVKRSIIPTLWIIVIVYVLCIDLKGVWTDEGNRVAIMSGGQSWQEFNRTGGSGSFADVLDALAPTNFQPLFYLAGHAVMRLSRSHSDVLLRLVNVLWLLLAAQGLLRFFRTYSDWTRLFGILTLTLNGFMLMHVMQIREYTMFVALTIWSSCLCFEILEMNGPPRLETWWPRLVAYGVLMALLFYSHVYCVFALAAQAVMLLTRKAHRFAFLRAVTLSYGVAAGLALPWLITVYVRFPHKFDVATWDTRSASFGLLAEGLLNGFKDLLTYGVWAGHPLMQAFAILVIVGIPAAWGVSWRRGERVDRRSVYGLLLAVFFAIFQIAYFFISQPLSIWPRYFIAYFVGYTVMATCAFSVLERVAQQAVGRPWKWAAAGVFLLVCMAGVAQVQLYRRDPFMDTGMSEDCNWRVVTRAMIQHVRPDETIGYYMPLQAWTIAVYYPFYAHEMSYADLLRFKPTPTLWILDTSGTQDILRQVLTRLESQRFRQTQAVGLPCGFRLLRYEEMSAALSPTRDLAK